MSTLAAIVTKLRDYMKSDPNDAVWSTSAKNAAVNTGYFQVQKDGNFKWPENEATTTFNLAAGTQEYALSTYISDFIRNDLVQFTDTAGEIYPTTKAQQLRNSLSGNARPTNYYIFNAKLGFYPAPDAAYTVRLLYRKRLPTLTDVVNSSFPVDFDDAVAMYAAYKIWSTTKNQAKAAQALEDYKMAIQQLKNAYLFQDTAMLAFPFQRGGNSRRMQYDPNILN